MMLYNILFLYDCGFFSVIKYNVELYWVIFISSIIISQHIKCVCVIIIKRLSNISSSANIVHLSQYNSL